MDDQRHDVFICFRGDEPFGTSTIRTAIVQPLFTSLNRMGASVFMDDETIEPGRDIPDAILQGLLRTRGGGAALILVSPDFFGRVWPMIEMACLYKLRNRPDENQIHLFVVCFNLTPEQIQQHAFVTAFFPQLGHIKFLVPPTHIDPGAVLQFIKYLSEKVETWIKSNFVALGQTRTDSFRYFKSRLVNLPNQCEISQTFATGLGFDNFLLADQPCSLSMVLAAAKTQNLVTENNLETLFQLVNGLQRDTIFLDSARVILRYMDSYLRKWLNLESEISLLQHESRRVRDWFAENIQDNAPVAVPNHVNVVPQQAPAPERALAPQEPALASPPLQIVQIIANENENVRQLSNLFDAATSLARVCAIVVVAVFLAFINKIPIAQAFGFGSLYLAFRKEDADLASIHNNPKVQIVTPDNGVEFEIDATNTWSWSLTLDEQGVLNDDVQNKLALLIASFALEGACKFRVHRIQENNHFAVFFIPSQTDIDSARSIFEQEGFMEKFEQAYNTFDATAKDQVGFCGGCGVVQRTSPDNPYLCRLGHLQAVHILDQPIPAEKAVKVGFEWMPHNLNRRVDLLISCEQHDEIVSSLKDYFSRDTYSVITSENREMSSFLQAVLSTRGGGIALVFMTKNYMMQSRTISELACLYEVRQDIHLIIACVGTTKSQVLQNVMIQELCPDLSSHLFLECDSEDSVYSLLRNQISQELLQHVIPGFRRDQSYLVLKDRLAACFANSLGRAFAKIAIKLDLESISVMNWSDLLKQAELNGKFGEEHIDQLRQAIFILPDTELNSNDRTAALKIIQRYEKKWLADWTSKEVPALDKIGERAKTNFEFQAPLNKTLTGHTDTVLQAGSKSILSKTDVSRVFVIKHQQIQSESFFAQRGDNLNVVGSEATLTSLQQRSPKIVARNLTDSNPSLLTVDISNNNLQPTQDLSGLQHLGESLKKNKLLRALNLSDTQMDDEGVKILCDALKENNTLETLELQFNNVGDEGARSISRMLLKNNSLTLIDLSFNSIGEDGLSALGLCFEHNDKLKTLRLAHNKFTLTAFRIFIDGLAKNTSITSLSLANNGLGRFYVELGSLLSNKVLKELNIRYNDFGERGFDYISACLRTNNCLTSLNITDNDVGLEPHQRLIESLINNDSLEELVIRGFGDSETTKLVESYKNAFPEPRQLKLLIAGRHNIVDLTLYSATNVFLLGYSSVGKTSLRQAIKAHNPYLPQLGLFWVSTPGFTQMFEMDLMQKVGERLFNFIDVGGQEHYHSGWYLLLQAKRAMFIICADATADDYASHVDFFLRLLCMRLNSKNRADAENLPIVILVFTHFDKCSLSKKTEIQDIVNNRKNKFKDRLDIQREHFCMDATRSNKDPMKEFIQFLHRISQIVDERSDKIIGHVELDKALQYIQKPSKRIFFTRNQLELEVYRSQAKIDVGTFIDLCQNAGIFLKVEVDTLRSNDIYCVNLQRFGQDVLSLFFEEKKTSDTSMPLLLCHKKWTANEFIEKLRTIAQVEEDSEHLLKVLYALDLCVQDPDGSFMFPALALSDLPLEPNFGRRIAQPRSIVHPETTFGALNLWYDNPFNNNNVVSLGRRFIVPDFDYTSMLPPALLSQVICRVINQEAGHIQKKLLWREGVIAQVSDPKTSEIVAVFIIHVPGITPPTPGQRVKIAAAPRLQELNILVRATSSLTAVALLARLESAVLIVRNDRWPNLLLDLQVLLPDDVAKAITKTEEGGILKMYSSDSVSSILNRPKSVRHKLIPELYPPSPAHSSLQANFNMGALSICLTARDKDNQILANDVSYVVSMCEDVRADPLLFGNFFPLNYMNDQRMYCYTREHCPSSVYVRVFTSDRQPFLPLHFFNRATLTLTPIADPIASQLPKPVNPWLGILEKFVQADLPKLAKLAQEELELVTKNNQQKAQFLKKMHDGVRISFAAYDVNQPESIHRIVFQGTSNHAEKCQQIEWHVLESGPVYVTFVRDQELFVAIRGTTTDRDVVIDLTAALVPIADGRGLVHYGFNIYADQVLKHFMHKFGIQPGKAPPPTISQRLHMCGHSLGGAVAQLFAVRLRKWWLGDIFVTTIGAPLVGNYEFAMYAKEQVPQINNIIHPDDPVPQLLNAITPYALLGNIYVIGQGLQTLHEDHALVRYLQKGFVSSFYTRAARSGQKHRAKFAEAVTSLCTELALFESSISS